MTIFIPLCVGTILRPLGSPLAVLAPLLGLRSSCQGKLAWMALGVGGVAVSRIPRRPRLGRSLSSSSLVLGTSHSLHGGAPRSPGASVGTHPAVRWRSACAGGDGVPLSGTRSRCTPWSPGCPCRAAPSSAPPRPPEDGSSLNIAVCEIKTRTKMQSMELLYKRSN